MSILGFDDDNIIRPVEVPDFLAHVVPFAHRGDQFLVALHEPLARFDHHVLHRLHPAFTLLVEIQRRLLQVERRDVELLLFPLLVLLPVLLNAHDLAVSLLVLVEGALHQEQFFDGLNQRVGRCFLAFMQHNRQLDELAQCLCE